MKKLLVGIFLLVLFLISCRSITTQKVELVNEPKIIVIKNQEVKDVYFLDLEITGYINGKAIIKLENIKEQIIENNFTFIYNADWYSNEAIIYFEPIDVYQGNITIKYKFFSL